MTPARTRILLRSAGYVLAGALALAWTLARTRPDPRGDLARLLPEVARDHTGRTNFLQNSVSLGFLPAGRGWILSLYVGASTEFAPARYLLLTRLDDVLTGELLARPGPSGTIVLRGAELSDYLRRASLDLAPLEEVYRARR